MREEVSLSVGEAVESVAWGGLVALPRPPCLEFGGVLVDNNSICKSDTNAV